MLDLKTIEGESCQMSNVWIACEAELQQIGIESL